jgi:predicted  nucleic acid-binding Zn-ribbon protein
MLERLVLKSLDNAEFLLFSVIDEEGKNFLDPDIGRVLFKLAQSVENISDLSEEIKTRLNANAAQYAKATAAEVGEENNAHFKEATEKLIRWSEDQVAAATHKIETLRARQLEVEREIRHAKTLDEQVPLQKELDNIRRDIRRARANVSSVEDETDEKRRRLLDALQRKLIPEVKREELFTIRWNVI